MVQAEKQKKVFLSLCGQRDYDLLTGNEAMTQADFERIMSIPADSEPSFLKHSTVIPL